MYVWNDDQAGIFAGAKYLAELRHVTDSLTHVLTAQRP